MKMPPAIPRKEKGQSLVELALVFTLLLLLLTGIIDLGSMFYTYTALQDTAQEGAIYASAHATEPTLIADRIKQSASSPIDASNITDISVTCYDVGGVKAPCVKGDINSCQGQLITVSVDYTYYWTMPIHFGSQPVVLKASVTNTILQSPDTIATLEAKKPPEACP